VCTFGGGRLKEFFDECEAGVKYASPDMIFRCLFRCRVLGLLSAHSAAVDETAERMLAPHFVHFDTDDGLSPGTALNFVSSAVSLTFERNCFVYN
jgi:hypothetical protein